MLRPGRLGLEQREHEHQPCEHGEHRGQQPSGAAQPELAQIDVAAALVLGDQQQGDQVAQIPVNTQTPRNPPRPLPRVLS